MDNELRKKIDGSAKAIGALMEYSWAEDPETKEYALSKIIDYYVEEKRFGALKEMCLSGVLPEKTKEKAGMAILGSITQQGGSRAPAEGMLDDISLSRNCPERVQIAAGKLRVDLLLTRVDAGKEPEATLAKRKIEGIAKHGKHHLAVREYARNSLDALELAKEGKAIVPPRKGGGAAVQPKKAKQIR